VPLKHQDVALVAVSLVAVSALVLAAFSLSARRLASPAAVRKLLHALVGGWTLFVTPLFDRLGWALVLPALFVAVNASPQARPLFKNIADTPEQAKGLWTFPVGVVLAYVLFWEPGNRPAILAGLTALAFADPAAAILGKRFGQRRYRWFGGQGRTVEGSLVFFAVTAIAAGFLATFPHPPHVPPTGVVPWRAAIGCGLAGSAVEAATPSGWDNLTIPVAVAAAYRFLVA
jgi:dolichol kinase